MLKILIILAALSCIGIYFNTLPEEKKQKQKIIKVRCEVACHIS